MTSAEATSRRRVDVLGVELANNRLSPAAVAVGRGLEAALEAALRSGGAAWRERVDACSDVEAGTLASVEAIGRARVALQRVERIVGSRGAMLLRDLLADGLSFEQLAQRHGRPTRRGIASVASQVRADLETLARAHAARGAAPAAMPDKHSRAADAIKMRTVAL